MPHEIRQQHIHWTTEEFNGFHDNLKHSASAHLPFSEKHGSCTLDLYLHLLDFDAPLGSHHLFPWHLTSQSDDAELISAP